MKKSLWVVLVIVTIVLASCGPAMVPSAAPQTATGEVFTVALPQIVVSFDQNGSPSIGGIDAAKLQSYGLAVPAVAMDPNVIAAMQANNIQNIELRQTGNGIVVFVNGKAMPYLAWSDESLAQLTDLAGMFGAANPQALTVLKKVMPIARRLGLDLVVQFPAAPGKEAIPLATPEEVVKAMAAPSNAPASAVAQFEIKYDDQGVPSILGISASDLAAMGLSLPLALDPRVLAQLQANNLQSLEFRSKGDGVYVYVNGTALPNIAWDEKLLGNAVDLWLQMNPGVSQYVPTDVIKSLAPSIARADLGVLVHFPVKSGVRPIAVKMH